MYCSLGIAAGQAKILRLPREKIGHALVLAAVPSVPLRVTRFGELSEWKAAATGHAAMTATFAVRLAAAGMSGPSEPFQGKDGLLERVWPTFDLHADTSGPVGDRASQPQTASGVLLGSGPGGLGHGAARPCRRWRDCSDRRGDLRERVALDRGGRGDAAEKWRPPTRETADHSMPYLMAAVFVDGELSERGLHAARGCATRSCSRSWIASASSSVTDLTARATRDSCPTELTVTPQRTVRRCRRPRTCPRGHQANPMSDDEVSAKFATLAPHALPAAQAGELGSSCWHLAELASLERVATSVPLLRPPVSTS